MTFSVPVAIDDDRTDSIRLNLYKILYFNLSVFHFCIRHGCWAWYLCAYVSYVRHQYYNKRYNNNKMCAFTYAHPMQCTYLF